MSRIVGTPEYQQMTIRSWSHDDQAAPPPRGRSIDGARRVRPRSWARPESTGFGRLFPMSTHLVPPGQPGLDGTWAFSMRPPPKAVAPVDLSGSTFGWSTIACGAAAHPSRDAYFELAKRGVRTVVDLRAEDDVRDDEVFLTGLGVRLIRTPIRDGQTPTTAQVDQFLEAIRSSEGTVLVHCGAGVGRTGTMAAAYLVRSGAATPRDALWRNLAVGPPSLEQISYVAGLANGFAAPSLVVRALSRTLDAPRRLWSRLRSRPTRTTVGRS